MKMRLSPLLLIACFAIGLNANEGVVLLHGLSRSSGSMNKMQQALEDAGFIVVNQSYPSRKQMVRDLSQLAVGAALEDARLADCDKVHFVTHSLGGILVRSYFASHHDPRLGRVVMLGPPNGGSEVVDKIGDWWLFHALNGPAGSELGTGSDSVPNQLGRVDFEVGIIAGNRSINWINSLMIHGPDDGKVSVERTRVAGMKAHITIPVSHPFLMKRRPVIDLTIQFLKHGSFTPRGGD